MLIFAPYDKFAQSAEVLQQFDLLKQIDTVNGVLTLLHGEDPSEYVNEPAMMAWAGHEPQLALYGLILVEEALSRHMKFRMDRKTEQFEWHLSTATSGEFNMALPHWFGDQRIHNSHKSELLRCNRRHYQKYFSVDPSLPIVWPLNGTDLEH